MPPSLPVTVFFYMCIAFYCVQTRIFFFVLIQLSRKGKDNAEQEANYTDSKWVVKMAKKKKKRSLNKVPGRQEWCVCVYVCSFNAADQQSFTQSACWISIFQVLFSYYLETCKCLLNIEEPKLNPVWGRNRRHGLINQKLKICMCFLVVWARLYGFVYTCLRNCKLQ